MTNIGNDIKDMGGNVKSAVSDTAITAEIKAKYLSDSDVSALSIGVETSDHKVTLTGHVDDRNIAQRAEQIARGVDGVDDVINNIDID